MALRILNCEYDRLNSSFSSAIRSGIFVRDRLFEGRFVFFVFQLYRRHGRQAFLVEKLLCGRQRHEDSAIFKTIGRLQNADHGKCLTPDRDIAADLGLQEFSGPFAQHHAARIFSEVSRLPASQLYHECARRTAPPQSR